MQARLAQAQARLQKLLDDAERAVEAYNAARYLLQQAQVAAADAQARADAAKQDLASAQLDLGRFAAASYRMGGDLGTFASMLDADGPQDLMDQASDLANVAASHDAALDRVAAARIVADVLSQQAATALQAQADATEQVRLAKAEAQAKVATQREQIGGLQKLTHRLSTKLSQTKARAGELSQQRKDGLARQRAERAAAAAAAAAAASGSGTPNGSDDSDNSSHWSPSFTGGTSYGTPAGAAKAIAYARKQLGKPYVYAAAGPNSFDCSGLTMMAWRAGGVNLPHWSVAQFAQAKKIPASEARPGDLVFFAYDVTDPGTIHHVALYLGNGMMLHAPHTGDVVREAAVYSDGLIGFARP
jgi:cell wall-associated NlpC family hydrolase